MKFKVGDKVTVVEFREKLGYNIVGHTGIVTLVDQDPDLPFPYRVDLGEGYIGFDGVSGQLYLEEELELVVD